MASDDDLEKVRRGDKDFPRYPNGADLTDADLEGADLTDVNLTDADLENANLTGADLTGANLENVNLRGVNLTDVDLTRVRLIDAALTGAKLRNVNDLHITASSRAQILKSGRQNYASQETADKIRWWC